MRTVFPPTLRFSPIPTPPVTTNAPELLLFEIVVLFINNVPVNVFDRLVPL